MLPFSFLSLGIRALPYLAVTAASIYLTSQWMSWKNEGKLSDLRAELNQQCEAAAEKLKGANDELQRTQADIAGKLAKYKRLHPNTCVKLSESAQSTASGGEYAGSGGAVAGSSDDFRDYFADCEEYRSQRIILEGLLK